MNSEILNSLTSFLIIGFIIVFTEVHLIRELSEIDNEDDSDSIQKKKE